MLENISWNWSSIWVAVIFLWGAMITAGAQIQFRDAIAFGKIEQEGWGCVNALLGLYKWTSIVFAGLTLVTMLQGYPFNTLSWWVAGVWLLFIINRNNGVVQAIQGPR
jgi:hypothetical protein